MSAIINYTSYNTPQNAIQVSTIVRSGVQNRHLPAIREEKGHSYPYTKYFGNKNKLNGMDVYLHGTIKETQGSWANNQLSGLYALSRCTYRRSDGKGNPDPILGFLKQETKEKDDFQKKVEIAKILGFPGMRYTSDIVYAVDNYEEKSASSLYTKEGTLSPGSITVATILNPMVYGKSSNLLPEHDIRNVDNRIPLDAFNNAEYEGVIVPTNEHSQVHALWFMGEWITFIDLKASTNVNNSGISSREYVQRWLSFVKKDWSDLNKKCMYTFAINDNSGAQNTLNPVGTFYDTTLATVTSVAEGYTVDVRKEFSRLGQPMVDMSTVLSNLLVEEPTAYLFINPNGSRFIYGNEAFVLSHYLRNKSIDLNQRYRELLSRNFRYANIFQYYYQRYIKIDLSTIKMLSNAVHYYINGKCYHLKHKAQDAVFDDPQSKKDLSNLAKLVYSYLKINSNPTVYNEVVRNGNSIVETLMQKDDLLKIIPEHKPGKLLFSLHDITIAVINNLDNKVVTTAINFLRSKKYPLAILFATGSWSNFNYEDDSVIFTESGFLRPPYFALKSHVDIINGNIKAHKLELKPMSLKVMYDRKDYDPKIIEFNKGKWTQDTYYLEAAKRFPKVASELDCFLPQNFFSEMKQCKKNTCKFSV